MQNRDKIILFLAKSKDWTKSKLAKELNISRPTLDKKIESNYFEDDEKAMLRYIGAI